MTGSVFHGDTQPSWLDPQLSKPSALVNTTRCLLSEAFLSTPMSQQQKDMTARLNDEARHDIGKKCLVMPTLAFTTDYDDQQDAILEMISRYNAFDSGITLFELRDFGVIFRENDGSWTNQTPAGDWTLQAVYWQFEYTDLDYQRPSFAPWDALQTARALILMLPNEFI